MTLTPNQFIGCIIISIMFAGVIILLCMEGYRYGSDRSVISGRQVIIRMIGGVFTLCLLAQVFKGILFFQADSTTNMTYIQFWMHCVLLAALAISIALIDCLYVWQFRRMHRQKLRSEKRRIELQVLKAQQNEYLLNHKKTENK